MNDLTAPSAQYKPAPEDDGEPRRVVAGNTAHKDVPVRCGIWFVVGNSTSAAAGSTSATAGADNYMPNNWIDYYTCTPGQAFAFISTSTTTGYVSVTEMT
jgi:hypothetical protein